jgi:hypothetical protein
MLPAYVSFSADGPDHFGGFDYERYCECSGLLLMLVNFNKRARVKLFQCQKCPYVLVETCNEQKAINEKATIEKEIEKVDLLFQNVTDWGDDVDIGNIDGSYNIEIMPKAKYNNIQPKKRPKLFLKALKIEFGPSFEQKVSKPKIDTTKIDSNDWEESYEKSHIVDKYFDKFAYYMDLDPQCCLLYC